MNVKISTVAFFMALAFMSLALAGCGSLTSFSAPSGKKETASFPTPILTVKPELDYSSEYPSCVVAAQRLADNVEVGMSLKDVRRLVGQPRWMIPGSWWWSKSFSSAGKPRVRFGYERGRDHTAITGIDTDSSRCEPDDEA